MAFHERIEDILLKVINIRYTVYTVYTVIWVVEFSREGYINFISFKNINLVAHFL